MKTSVAAQLQKALMTTRNYIQTSYFSLKERLEEMEQKADSELKKRNTPSQKAQAKEQKPKKDVKASSPRPQKVGATTTQAQPKPSKKASAKKPKTQKASSGTSSDLPIRNYQKLTVPEIKKKLTQLDDQDIKRLKSYEGQHKNRKTLIEAFDRQLH